MQQDNTSFARLVFNVLDPLPSTERALNCATCWFRGEEGKRNQWKNKSLTQNKNQGTLLNSEDRCCFIIKPLCCCSHGNKETNIWSSVTPSTKIPVRMFWKAFLSVWALLFSEWKLCAAVLNSCIGDKVKLCTQPHEHYLSLQFFKNNCIRKSLPSTNNKCEAPGKTQMKCVTVVTFGHLLLVWVYIFLNPLFRAGQS